MKIDLEAVPYVDGHMHAPLAARPATADEYAWPWYEGNIEYLEMAAELVPFRWGMRQMGEWLDCEPEEAAIVAAIAARGSDAEWRAECIKRGNVAGLVLDTGYPPPDVVVPAPELAQQVPVAWLVRIEVEAQRLLAESTSLDDWLDRVDAASDAGLDAGAAGLKSIIAYRSGLGVSPVDMAAAHAAYGHASAAARAGEEVRLSAKPLNDLLVLRALDVCRRRGVSLQLHAGYGDRDIDLRLGSPFAFRWALESGAADGVEVVFLHASWPHIRDAAVMADPPPRLRRHRHVHPADRPRRPGGVLGARPSRSRRSRASTPPATPPACSSTSRSAPSVPGRRWGSRSASWSRRASCSIRGRAGRRADPRRQLAAVVRPGMITTSRTGMPRLPVRRGPDRGARRVAARVVSRSPAAVPGRPRRERGGARRPRAAPARRRARRSALPRPGLRAGARRLRGAGGRRSRPLGERGRPPRRHAVHVGDVPPAGLVPDPGGANGGPGEPAGERPATSTAGCQPSAPVSDPASEDPLGSDPRWSFSGVRPRARDTRGRRADRAICAVWACWGPDNACSVRAFIV